MHLQCRGSRGLFPMPDHRGGYCGRHRERRAYTTDVGCRLLVQGLSDTRADGDRRVSVAAVRTRCLQKALSLERGVFAERYSRTALSLKPPNRLYEPGPAKVDDTKLRRRCYAVLVNLPLQCCTAWCRLRGYAILPANDKGMNS